MLSTMIASILSFRWKKDENPLQRPFGGVPRAGACRVDAKKPAQGGVRKMHGRSEVSLGCATAVAPDEGCWGVAVLQSMVLFGSRPAFVHCELCDEACWPHFYFDAQP